MVHLKPLSIYNKTKKILESKDTELSIAKLNEINNVIYSCNTIYLSLLIELEKDEFTDDSEVNEILYSKINDVKKGLQNLLEATSELKNELHM